MYQGHDDQYHRADAQENPNPARQTGNAPNTHRMKRFKRTDGIGKKQKRKAGNQLPNVSAQHPEFPFSSKKCTAKKAEPSDKNQQIQCGFKALVSLYILLSLLFARLTAYRKRSGSYFCLERFFRQILAAVNAFLHHRAPYFCR